MKYAVFGSIEINAIHGKEQVMSGAGIGAIYALLLCGEKGSLVYGNGNDFGLYFDDWFSANGLSKDALVPRVDYITKNNIREKGGAVVSESFYGDNFNYMNEGSLFLATADIEPYIKRVRLFYLLRKYGQCLCQYHAAV